MSWYDGTLTAAAGQLKTILDAKLVLNSFWHIEDAGAAANVGVYHCLDADNNVDFVVEVEDDQANYAMITLWDAWDSGAHAGTGDNFGGTTEYVIQKTAGGYGLSVLDHRFIYVNKEAFKASYVGQLSRFDVTKNMPIVIIGDSTGASNPIGRGYLSTLSYWQALWDELGTTRTLYHNGYYSAGATNFISLISDGRYWVAETPVHNSSTLKLLGLLEGAMVLGGNASGLANGDTVTDSNSVAWLAVIATSNGNCLIRKS